MINDPGIYDLPMVEYLADPCPEPSLSTGIVAAITKQSPAHAWLKHPRLGRAQGDYATRADIGSAVHARVLGGARVVYLPYDDFRKKAAKNARDEAYALGRLPLLVKHMEMIEATASSAIALLDRVIGPDRLCEQTVIWRHAAGVWCKSRPDIIVASKRLIIDLKTCSHAAPGEWIRRSLWSSNYDLQAALGCDGLYTLSGHAHDFLFLAVEIDPPYGCSLIGVGASMLDIANAKMLRAAKTWRKCLDANAWPSYNDEVVYAEASSWAVWEHENGERE